MPRYSGRTREQSARLAASPAGRRANSQFRTAADSGRGANSAGVSVNRYTSGSMSGYYESGRRHRYTGTNLAGESGKITKRQRYYEQRISAGLVGG